MRLLPGMLSMRLAGSAPPPGKERKSALSLARSYASRMAAGLLRLHADRRLIVERETRLRGRFATAHPHVPTVVLPALATDVHDLDGLRRIGELLGAEVA